MSAGDCDQVLRSGDVENCVSTHKPDPVVLCFPSAARRVRYYEEGIVQK